MGLDYLIYMKAKKLIRMKEPIIESITSTCREIRGITMVVTVILALVPIVSSSASAREKFDPTQLEFIDNGTIKLGVSKDLGGAITYLSKSGSNENVINNYDWGRQIQMSFFSGPVPYHEKGQKPKEHWKHIGWNPIQAGDDHSHGSKVTSFKKTKTTIYVKCIPMQWPLDNIPGECTYECWITLKDQTAEVRCRLNNARSDKTQYPGRHQELPAVYTNGPYYRLMTYRGDKPFTGGELFRIPKKPAGKRGWDYWLATEHWAALVNDDDWGLGIYKPNNSLFIGGFSGKEGKGSTHDNPTGYIAPLHTEILDHNITYDYHYALILGSLDEIRAHAVREGRGAGLPDWKFEKDRQHWRYHATGNQGTDTGWPIQGFIELDLAKKGIAAVSPPTLWQAGDAPVLHIEAAFKTDQKQAAVAWTAYDGKSQRPNFDPNNRLQFDIVGDGRFRTYKVDLSSAESYRGAMSYLFFRPSLAPEEGGWVKIKRIRLGK